MPISNTVRARLSDPWLRVFEKLRLVRGKQSRQDYAPRVFILGLIAEGAIVDADGNPRLPDEVEASGCNPNRVTAATPPVDLARIHINVRQKTRFKHLASLVPGCSLDVDEAKKKRDLLYPLLRKVEVLAWLASCPTGAKIRDGEIPKKKSESGAKRGSYNTARKKAVNGAVAVLTEEQRPIFIRELFDLLKARKCTPKDYSARDDVTRYIKESPLFEFEPFYELVSLAKEKVLSPTIEEALIENGMLEEPKTIEASIAQAMEANPPVIEEEPASVQEASAGTESETKSASPKVPSFFPKNWSPVG